MITLRFYNSPGLGRGTFWEEVFVTPEEAQARWRQMVRQGYKVVTQPEGVTDGSGDRETEGDEAEEGLPSVI